MSRGASARGRRTMRRAAERREKTGVNEARVPASQLVSLVASSQLTEAEMDDCTCGHSAMQHSGDDNMGSCSADGCTCDGFTVATAAETEEFAIPTDVNYRPSTGTSDCGSCSFFEEGNCTKFDETVDSDYVCDDWKAAAEANSLAAAAEVVWDSEDGVMDLMGDIAALLNPGDSWNWWVVDLSLGGDLAILCDSDEWEYYLVPLTIGADKEPVLAPRDQWVTIDSAWVKSAESLAYMQKLVELQKIEQKTEIIAAALPAEKLDAAFATMVEGIEDEKLLSFIRVRFDDFKLKSLSADGAPELAVAPVDSAVVPTTGAQWTATLCPEARLTEDGRAFAPESIEWRELPLTLMGMVVTSEGGHIGAELCGRIDRIYREGDLIKGEGVFDSGNFGSEVARLVADGTLRGVSVDIAVLQYEVGAKSDFFDADGNWIADASRDKKEVDLVDLLMGTDEDTIFVVTEGIIGAATVCPFQAFADATIESQSSLVASAQREGVWTITSQAGFVVTGKPEGAATIVASASLEETALVAPLRPPTEWFADPELEELTALTISDDGRIYGHAWSWETCHIGIPGVCQTAPHSNTNYAYYELKEVECEDGARVPVGTITLDTEHADRQLGRSAASRHYDDTGTAVADVCVGEDEFGGWFSGALRSDLTAEKVRALRGAVLSGDWRSVSGNLELVGLLACNIPGFPVPRPGALVASGDDGCNQVLSLVAAGMHQGKESLSGDAIRAKLAALAEKATGDRFAALAAAAEPEAA